MELIQSLTKKKGFFKVGSLVTSSNLFLIALSLISLISFSSTTVRRDFISSLREDWNLCRDRIRELIDPVVSWFQAGQERLQTVKQRISDWTTRGKYFFLNAVLLLV